MRSPVFWCGVILGALAYPAGQVTARLITRNPLLYPR